MSKKQHARAAQRRQQSLSSRREYIAALEEERRGYQIRGLKDRAKAVDAEIAKARKGLPDDEDETQDPPDPDPETKTPQGNGSAKGVLDEFDPSARNVDDVVAYFEKDDTTAEEVARVQAAEREGKDRKTITEWTPGTTPPAP